MQQFNLRVVKADDEAAVVPHEVAETIMSDIQTLLFDVGEMMVRQELRTQSSLDGAIRERFTLKVATSESADSPLLEDALAAICSEMDRVRLKRISREAPKNHIEAIWRPRIARDLLTIANHLEGYLMFYGFGTDLNRYRLNSREDLAEEAATDVSAVACAMIGTVSRDPSRQFRWLLSNGIDTVPMTFGDKMEKDDIAILPDAGPLIATGVLHLVKGKPSGVTDVGDCFEFRLVKFHRIITAQRDLVLLNPAVAYPGYDYSTSMWTLTNDDLGIHIEKPSWDEAVSAFHKFFVFLWETYVESKGQFSGEEKEISDLLSSLAFP